MEFSSNNQKSPSRQDSKNLNGQHTCPERHHCSSHVSPFTQNVAQRSLAAPPTLNQVSRSNIGYLFQLQQTIGNHQLQKMIVAKTSDNVPERHEALDLNRAKRFGKMLGADFSDVKLHEGDGVARDHGARAVTFGNDIHFAGGTNSAENDSLLGHELVHTVQQEASPRRENSPLESGSEETAENEATRLGNSLSHGRGGRVQIAAPGGKCPRKRIRPNQHIVEQSKQPIKPATTYESTFENGMPNSALPPGRSAKNAAAVQQVQPPPGINRPPAEKNLRRHSTRSIVTRPDRVRLKSAQFLKRQPPSSKSAMAQTRLPPTPKPSAPRTRPVPPPDFPTDARSSDQARRLATEGFQLAQQIRDRVATMSRYNIATAEQQAAQLQAEIATQVDTLEGQLSSAQLSIAGHSDLSSEAILSCQQAAQKGVSDAGETGVEQVKQAGEQARGNAPIAGDQSTSDFEGAATDEAARFRKESEGRSRQAASPTSIGGESADEQAEMSESVGDQAMQNFEQDASNVESQTQSVASQYASAVSSSVTSFVGSLGDVLPRITSGISGLVEAAIGEFDDTGNRANDLIVSLAQQVDERLVSGTDIVSSDLTRGTQSTIDALMRSASLHVAEVESQGYALADALEERANLQAESIADMQPEPAKQAANNASEALREAATSAESQLSEIDASLTVGLQVHAGLAANEMTQAAANAGVQIHTVAEQTGQKIGQATAATVQNFSSGVGMVSQQLEQTSAEAASEIEQREANYESTLQQETGKSQQRLTGEVNRLSTEQQANLGVIQNKKSRASTDISSQYSNLKAEGNSRSRDDVQRNAAEGQSLLEYILPTSWTEAIRNWFTAAWARWVTGFIYGVISAILGILVIVAIAVVAGFFFGPIGVAVVLIAALLLGAGMGIYSRLTAFEIYNGRGPGTWEWIGSVLLGIADITGIPQIIEGIVGARAFSNGHDMDAFESGEAVGSGIVQLIAIILLIRGAKGRGLRGPRGAKSPEIRPPETRPPETRSPETRPPETRPPETRPPETRPPETRPPETRPPETRPSERSPGELVRDSNPKQRSGETAEEARARSEAARAEIQSRGYCFVKGTPVQTPDGPIPIDQLSRGQYVHAKYESQEVSIYRVLDRIVGQTQTIFNIEIAGQEKIAATRKHPFFVIGKGWTAANALVIDDRLLSLDGLIVPITAISCKRLERPVATYNIHVEDVHTYFVGRTLSVWVHNVDPDDAIFNEDLLWGLGAKGPRARPPDPARSIPGDTDGASAWNTKSSEEVGRFLGSRAPSNSNSNHGAITRAQLAEQGLIAVETPGEGAPAEAGIRHFSIRPATNPDPSNPLTNAEITEVQAKLDAIEPIAKAKPKQFGCA